MKQVIGFLFTESFLRDFANRGFTVIEEPSPSGEGFRVFTIPLEGQIQFSFHVIFDEEAYRRRYRIDHFFPFTKEVEGSPQAAIQENTVSAVHEVLTKESCKENPWLGYFSIRKPGQIWALHLKCKDLKEFCRIAKPDRMGTWDANLAALIHLGPTCFDLIVTESKD